ncbi:hypothetical protein JRQ81_015555 [Phrynocephalus forsythii]|uniref:Olfactory receptor n=1 Tax=Phrynocephalus forsythii TaxID=171643 RepID=A0A9Q0XUS7_9SAUR|nr:hypothetical protein JRQ81_015555 [Phrynocephalus forsythii]
MREPQHLIPAQTSAVGPMDVRNQTRVMEFVFLGFSEIPPHGHTWFFLLFLAIYLVTIMGNATMVILIQVDRHLHNPMYFFLSHLACIDVGFSSVTIPKILANFLHQRHTIAYHQCMAQMFFLMAFAGSECVLLAVMAFDRYAAICQPLRYGHLMNSQVRVPLAVAAWVWGVLDSAIHTALATRLSFCGANHLDHIFCDVPPLLKIACSDTYVNELSLHLASIFMGFGPLLFILFSYAYILQAILRIRSNTGRRKAFSTCAAHLIVVMMFYGMGNVNYNRPPSGYSLQIDTLISSLYCCVTPMLNPLIYSLRNKEVKGALRNFLAGLKKEHISP